MLKKTILISILVMFSISVSALPKFLVEYKRNTQNLVEIKTINQTAKALICYVAIDGYKVFFILQPHQPSKWYKATDPRFNYNNFSTWCDYLSLYPEYKPNLK